MRIDVLVLGFLCMLIYACADNNPATSDTKTATTRKKATKEVQNAGEENLNPSTDGTLTDGDGAGTAGVCDQINNPRSCPPGMGSPFSGESDVMGVLLQALQRGIPNGKGLEGGKCSISDLNRVNNRYGGPQAIAFRVKKVHLADWFGDNGEVILLNPSANPSSVTVTYPAGLLHYEVKLTRGQVQDVADAFGLSGKYWDHNGLGQKIFPEQLHTKITVDPSSLSVLNFEHREEHNMWNLVFNDRIICNGGK